ncbi:MAG TPA: type III PLP-dependent enzyme [Microlunatus sp.]
MALRSGRVREWIGRYLVAELAGLTCALLAALAVTSWNPDQLAIAAYASALGEGVGFYAGFLVVRYLREDIDGPPRRRITVIVAAAVVEFGPAEIIDTALIRPAAMFLASLATGNVIIGVLIGKVAADIVFYGLAITSYEVLVRRLLRRFRHAEPVAEDRATETSSGSAIGMTVQAPTTGPELIMDLDVVTDRFTRFREALPGVAVHFAMKCQPDPPLLRHLLGLGSHFEVASLPELATLVELGVRPAEVIFSNPVKPWWHIRDAYAAGVHRFAADSDAELAKLAVHAPGTAVMIRLAVSPAASDVPSEGKFGVDPDEAVRLLLAAAAIGLRPWGLAFHVGSQMTDPRAWTAPIHDVRMIMERLQPAGLRLAALDIGGGFPADYGHPVPPIEDYGLLIGMALATLPYPVEVLAEPGRGLVADAGRLESTVIGIAERKGRRWAHLDVGAFNGVMEALETTRQLVLPMSDHREGPTARWAVTGPTCDSQDTLHYSVALSADLQVGDRVTLRTAGAYTTAYACAFNGFEVPGIRYQGPSSAGPAPVSPVLQVARR